MGLPGKIILFCQEQPLLAEIKEIILRLGDYSVFTEVNLGAVLVKIKQEIYDLILVKPLANQAAPEDLIAAIKEADPDAVVLVLLDNRDEEVIRKLIDSGVYDFLISPVNTDKLMFAIERGIKLRQLLTAKHKFFQELKENNQALGKQNMLLASRLEESANNLSRLYEDLRSTYLRTIKVLAQAIDARDHYTHSHSENVARFVVEIANFMKLPEKEIEILRQACELHDLGKIGIGDNILLKILPLTEEEWDQVRKHPVIGAQILEPLTFLNGVVELVRQHHEHYDGSGYPDGRKGNDILLGARIIHVADAYEAMRAGRAYRKKPLFKEEAVLEIKRNSGTQFDPKIVDIFLKVVDNL